MTPIAWRLHRAAAVLLLLVSAGCSSADTGGTPESGAPGEPEQANGFGHVHGLGTNPADGSLYVASHVGVFRQSETGFERVADRWQDTMGFAVAGEDRFLASGHPDLREDRPNHLGLIESTDAAETWKSLSLEGEADFHDLEIAGDRLYGYDALSGTLMVTTDLTSWTDVLTAPLYDVEADPSDPESLVMTDQRGALMALRVGGQPRLVPHAPRLGILEWAEPRILVGLGASGEVWVSTDSGSSWEQVGQVPGNPQAVTATGDRWHAASDRGLFTSIDGGATWERVDAATGGHD